MLKPHYFKGYFWSHHNVAGEEVETHKVGVKCVIYAPGLGKARQGAKQIIRGFRGELKFQYVGEPPADVPGIIAHTVR